MQNLFGTVCTVQVLVEFVMIVGWLAQRWIQHWAKWPGHVLEFFGRCEMEGNVDDGNTILAGREQCESYDTINTTQQINTIQIWLRD